jgi:hypothetical protein
LINKNERNGIDEQRNQPLQLPAQLVPRKMSVTTDQVLSFQSPTKGFLCPLSANKVGIDFLSFQIRDYDSKRMIFEVSKDNQDAVAKNSLNLADMSEDSYRRIKYNFSADVLRTPTISTILAFSVGDNEVEDFRMIERHYFRDQLIKSYDFTFGFCIPNSTNTWEAVYAVPLLEDSIVEDMIANPFETKSDSFYFVNDKLIMHNKAEYCYAPVQAEAKTADAAATAGAKTGKQKAMKYTSKLVAMGGAGGGGGAGLPTPEGKRSSANSGGAKAI